MYTCTQCKRKCGIIYKESKDWLCGKCWNDKLKAWSNLLTNNNNTMSVLAKAKKGVAPAKKMVAKKKVVKK